MKYWLMKSEAAVYSIDDLKRDKKTVWDGVRNYEARNFMRVMKSGDNAFFYHSNAEPSGVAGVMAVSRTAFADPSQFKRGDAHYDPKATLKSPLWSSVEVSFLQNFPRIVALEELRKTAALRDMALFRRSRLSVQPVTPAEWRTIIHLAKNAA
ncbi:MAG TPA: EVE domain-containing protein [Elusimicrobiota bacterium]|nr:EVE domain-containing protein [Elusimicrobiota bacterium]